MAHKSSYPPCLHQSFPNIKKTFLAHSLSFSLSLLSLHPQLIIYVTYALSAQSSVYYLSDQRASTIPWARGRDSKVSHFIPPYITPSTSNDEKCAIETPRQWQVTHFTHTLHTDRTNRCQLAAIIIWLVPSTGVRHCLLRVLCVVWKWNVYIQAIYMMVPCFISRG